MSVRTMPRWDKERQRETRRDKARRGVTRESCTAQRALRNAHLASAGHFANLLLGCFRLYCWVQALSWYQSLSSPTFGGLLAKMASIRLALMVGGGLSLPYLSPIST